MNKTEAHNESDTKIDPENIQKASLNDPENSATLIKAGTDPVMIETAFKSKRSRIPSDLEGLDEALKLLEYSGLGPNLKKRMDVLQDLEKSLTVMATASASAQKAIKKLRKLLAVSG